MFICGGWLNQLQFFHCVEYHAAFMSMNDGERDTQYIVVSKEQVTG